ncbi:MAG TPA: glycosyltransferase family 2 protein [Thermoanaerobaculia bacterium]
MEPRLVSVVLVTWNSAQYLPRCLEALRQQTHRAIELIAIDNASVDESLALVEPHATTVIRNDTNRGFSAAVNQGVAIAKGAYVLLLNPDCFLEPSYIEHLVAAMEAAPAFGSATGMLLRANGEPGEIDSCGMRMTRNGRHLDITSRPAVESNGEVFGVSGAAALHRMSFLRDVAIDGEVLDEDFFAYREDADLAWRGQLFGWRALCEPRAMAHHVRRVTPEVRKALPADINMHSVKNRFLLRLKNEGAYLALRNAPFELARDFVVLLASLTVERSSLAAFAWLWRNRARVLAKRRVIQQRRKVSDRELARWFS